MEAAVFDWFELSSEFSGLGWVGAGADGTRLIFFLGPWALPPSSTLGAFGSAVPVPSFCSPSGLLLSASVYQWPS